MTRHFDTSPPGRLNFREIAAAVRERSGNPTRPTDIQIVNSIGENAYRPHALAPPPFEGLEWDAANSLLIEDAERWMSAVLVPHFAALQAEWDDRAAQKRGYKSFEGARIAHMIAVGYAAFAAEFEALHKERRTRKDVDGWLLKKHRDHRGDFPPPAGAIPVLDEPVTRDERLLAADRTYTGRRLKRTGAPWLWPFRRHAEDPDFDAVDRRRLWPGGAG